MWRADQVYDVVLVLDYNFHPRALGAGSAIFFHLTTLERTPTAGCVAVTPLAMRRLLGQLSAKTYITIK
jgi:L,D-peptidoglycan transpeptidase YkuD (ErfK/YbiS/YcfS/YnhG family)